ncbi:hypothetical protein [Sphingomonas sp.]|jgi:hypothetical protein|uniref:hypothetical protein n=1 Tax=Sphingomonas sp. TaxID=28214 RepID=UPI002614B9FC|nr:hypothetical protein [Sphingomonas sp.]MDF2495046.1 hypothetical protein [Sphingomonas sp.]
MSLLTQIDCYLRRTGISPSTFGRQAVNDPRLVHDLRRGRSPGPRMRARVEAALRAPPPGEKPNGDTRPGMAN